MCGICGVIGERRGELAESRVRRMLGAQVHRGPDDQGLFVASNMAMGMRRLSIIDLAGGRQPVFNEDGTIGVVFNGEIYNFPQLRTDLESKGHRFETHSDTEVIVHAYEEWSTDCLKRLRGMFAFALWDGRADSSNRGGEKIGPRVLLARDRLGIKPLYYTVADGALLFASEVRALLASGAVLPRLAPQSLQAYLLFGSVVEPSTLIDGVFSLPPGHFLTAPCETVPDQPRPVAYWDLATEAQSAAAGSPVKLESAGRAVRPLLDEAVRSHLLADVPLGIFLSSGLDSTALAALATRAQRGLHTFTVVFDEQQFSEAAAASQTAKQLGTEHRELLLTGDDVLAKLDDAVGALDQPSMDGINTFFVSWAARQVGLKVALSGLGGDEVFGGYPTFLSTPKLAKLAVLGRSLPGGVRKTLASALAGLWGRRNGSRRPDVARKMAAVLQNPDALPHPYFYSRLLFTPLQAEAIFSKPFRAAIASERKIGASPWGSWLEQTAQKAIEMEGDSAVSYLELRTYMLNTLLRDTDSMSMHHSLEVRVPLLDHPLVEYVAGVPTAAKRRPGVNKALLVEALGDLLPAHIVQQPKRTFTLPWENWLHGPLGERVASRLGTPAPSLAPLLDESTVRSVWGSFIAGQTSWARAWSLYVLNEWVRRNLDHEQSSDILDRSAASAAAS